MKRARRKAQVDVGQQITAVIAIRNPLKRNHALTPLAAVHHNLPLPKAAPDSMAHGAARGPAAQKITQAAEGLLVHAEG